MTQDNSGLEDPVLTCIRSLQIIEESESNMDLTPIQSTNTLQEEELSKLPEMRPNYTQLDKNQMEQQLRREFNQELELSLTTSMSAMPMISSPK